MEPALLFSDEYKLKKHSREIRRNIPDGVLFEEILVCLPVKSLTIYKSVSKTWLYTIESRSFREAHRRRHSRDYSDQILFSAFKSIPDPITKSSYLLPSMHSFGPSLIKMTSRPLNVMLPSEMTQLNWPVIEPGAGHTPRRASVSVFGPIRTTGMYCIVSSVNFGPFPSLVSAKISICNPSMRDYKLANPFPPEEAARLLHLIDELSCRVHYGFGLAADGDYKVVVVMTTFSVFVSYVYSIKQGTWKKIVDSETATVSRLDLGGKPYYPEIIDYFRELCPQVFLNGCWHWMAMFRDKTCNVLSFDVDNDKFKVMCGPPSYRAAVGMLSVLNDHLAILYQSYESSSDCMDVISVWMMMEYGDEESWINVWTVNPEGNLMTTLVGISYSLREDGRNGGIHINRILFQDWGKQLFSCDESGLVEQQSGFDTSSCIFWNNLGISAYSETLELL